MSHTIRDLTDARDMLVLEDLQRAAWGYPETEVHPGNIFKIHAHVGGVVAVAEDESGRADGFVYGFPAFKGGELWHHSHMLALRPEARGTGLAEALKRHQRGKVLEMGLTRMTWTFDPLVTRNARFNLGKLGARALSYHPDWYAAEDLPADRLMVSWDLNRDTQTHPPPKPEGTVVLAREGERPGPFKAAFDAPRLLVEAPADTATLPLETRLAWRLALREALGQSLAQGYAVTDLARESGRVWYVLEKI